MLIWVLSAAKENRFWQLLTVLGIVLFVLAGLVALFVKGTPEEDGCYPDNDPAVAEMLKNEEVPWKYLSWRKYRNNTYSISVAVSYTHLEIRRSDIHRVNALQQLPATHWQ